MTTLATITANGDSAVLDSLNGNYAVSVEGTFDSATVQFVFLDEDDNELTPNATDWSFTAAPEFPQSFGFPANMKFLIRTSGAVTAPSLTVKAFKFYG